MGRSVLKSNDRAAKTGPAFRPVTEGSPPDTRATEPPDLENPSGGATHPWGLEASRPGAPQGAAR